MPSTATASTGRWLDAPRADLPRLDRPRADLSRADLPRVPLPPAGGGQGGGWLASARHVPSPNEDARPAGVEIDTVIVHHISLPPGHFSGDAIERLFTNRLDPHADPAFVAIAPLRVSAHFLVRRHGGVVQFVATDRRAWHAGASVLADRERCNDFSVGIELEGDGRRAFTDSQYRVLGRLLSILRARHPLRWIAGHSDVAPGRKTDPGPRFSWARIAPAMAACRLVRPFPERH